MLRHTKILGIMPTSTSNVLKLTYKVKGLVKPSLHYLKEPPISSSYFIR